MSKLAVIKTQENELSVNDFLDSITDEQKRKDSYVLLKLMEKAIKEKPKMWGTSMIGFGKLRYKSAATGREVDWFKIGFAPRKGNLSIHLVGDLKNYSDLLQKLGKHKTGAGCLYINKLDDVDIKILEKILVSASKSK